MISILPIALAAAIAGFGPLIHKPLADKIERWCEVKFKKRCTIENCRIIAGAIIASLVILAIWLVS